MLYTLQSNSATGAVFVDFGEGPLPATGMLNVTVSLVGVGNVDLYLNDNNDNPIPLPNGQSGPYQMQLPGFSIKYGVDGAVEFDWTYS